MPFSPVVLDRERDKFVETASGETAVRTQGTNTPSGLTGVGLITKLTIDDTAWVAAPTTPLAERVSILVQNISGNGGVVLWNYSNAAPATDGVQISDGSSKTADLTASYIIYCRMLSGSGTIIVDEVS